MNKKEGVSCITTHLLTYKTRNYERIFHFLHDIEILEVKHLFFTLLSKLARIAVRQVITGLFHRQAGKVFRKAAAGKVFEKIRE